LRQIGQELFHLHQSNCRTEPAASGKDCTIARLKEDHHNHVLKQSGHIEDRNVPKLHTSPTHTVSGRQDQNALHRVICDEDYEVVFKTSDSRKLPVR